jgi:hypothetical protein
MMGLGRHMCAPITGRAGIRGARGAAEGLGGRRIPRAEAPEAGAPGSRAARRSLRRTGRAVREHSALAAQACVRPSPLRTNPAALATCRRAAVVVVAGRGEGPRVGLRGGARHTAA